METAKLELEEPLETPVAPGIVRRSDRGLCVAGTKVSLFSIMDSLKSGSTEALFVGAGLTEEQLRLAQDYIDANREQFETAYEKYVRDGEEMERYYREREQQRREELKAKGLWGKPPSDPHLLPGWERLQALRREGKIE
jgi:hypothetical protein